MRNRGVEPIAQIRRVALRANKLIVGALAVSMANGALAGLTVPLGASLGVSLGGRLGEVLGNPLGLLLPIVSGGLLSVAAVSLVLGIYIVRRKRNR
jgi:hypothetical protein